jgi:hypothetical protein
VDGVRSPGDVLLPFNTYVQTPVTLTIEQACRSASALLTPLVDGARQNREDG